MNSFNPKLHFRPFLFQHICALSWLHRDAPAISDSLPSLGSLVLNKDNNAGTEDWDEASAATSNKQQRPIMMKSTGNVSELLDAKISVKDGIFVGDETIGGNEQSLQQSRIKGDKQENSAWNIKSNNPPNPSTLETSTLSKPAPISSTAAKWVPTRLRSEESNRDSSIIQTGAHQKNDIDDLFPDLATADKIIAQVEEQKLKNRVPPKVATKVSKPEQQEITKSSSENLSSTSTQPPESCSSPTATSSLEDHVVISTVVEEKCAVIEEKGIVDEEKCLVVEEKAIVFEETTNLITESGSDNNVLDTKDSENKAAIKKKKKKDLSTFKVSE